MQLKVANILNRILIVITVVILVLAAGYVMVYQYYPSLKTVYLILFVIITAVLLVAFRWLETNWDKRVITKMAQSGKIALATVTGGSRIMKMRDTGFTNYWLYEFDGVIHTPDMKRIDCKFYEKMNVATKEIPSGSFYVTYDEEKPAQIFIVPNALIGYLPQLQPIVKKFENNKQLKIKYLDTLYNKGMVIRTFREAIEEQQHQKRHAELEQQKQQASK